MEAVTEGECVMFAALLAARHVDTRRQMGPASVDLPASHIEPFLREDIAWAAHKLGELQRLAAEGEGWSLERLREALR